MKDSDLLDTILGMLRTVKDDPEKLQKLHDFMVNEIYEEPEEEDEVQIPEKYQPIMKEAAEWLGAGMICFLNPQTLELVTIPSGVVEDIDWDYDEEMQDELFNEYADFRKDMRRINAEWKKVVRIEPPDSNQSFRFMERFVHSLPDASPRHALRDALQRPKPFKNFNAIIHNSPAREAWFGFKQKCLEEYVAGEIRASVNDEAT